MISKKMENMVANSSAIRAMFEEGNRLAKIYGAENVFDFSLGNPNVPAPEEVKNAIIELLNEEDPIALHGYTNSNAGYADVREAVAQSLNERFGTEFEGKELNVSVARERTERTNRGGGYGSRGGYGNHNSSYGNHGGGNGYGNRRGFSDRNSSRGYNSYDEE